MNNLKPDHGINDLHTVGACKCCRPLYGSNRLEIVPFRNLFDNNRSPKFNEYGRRSYPAGQIF